MNTKQRTTITAWGLVLLGIAMIVIGAIGMIAPPIITGVGFILIAWWIYGAHQSPKSP